MRIKSLFIGVLAFILYLPKLKAQEILPADAMGLVKKNSKSIGLSDQQLKDVLVSKAFHDKTLDADLVYLQQTHLGIPVFNSIRTIAFKKEKPVSMSGNFLAPDAGKASQNAVATLKPFEAISAAAQYLSLETPLQKGELATKSTSQKLNFDGLGISQENITVELLWVISPDNKLVLTWQVNVLPNYNLR